MLHFSVGIFQANVEIVQRIKLPPKIGLINGLQSFLIFSIKRYNDLIKIDDNLSLNHVKVNLSDAELVNKAISLAYFNYFISKDRHRLSFNLW